MFVCLIEGYFPGNWLRGWVVEISICHDGGLSSVFFVLRFVTRWAAFVTYYTLRLMNVDDEYLRVLIMIVFKRNVPTYSDKQASGE